jgi:hypothetical protein
MAWETAATQESFLQKQKNLARGEVFFLFTLSSGYQAGEKKLPTLLGWMGG